MGLIETIGKGLAGLDTAIFIYFIEEHPVFSPLVDALFEEAAAGERELVTSAVTLLEVLVAPYRHGNQIMARRYEELLTSGRGLRMIELDREQLRSAALLRALHGLRLPDALQIAAALTAGCRAFITNDRRLPSVSSLRIVQLQDFV